MSELPPSGQPITKEYKNLEGIGGWLLLVAVGIVVTPFRMLYEMYQNLQVFGADTWGMLTSPTSESYMPGFGIFVVVETVANCLLLVAWLYVAVLFFSKRNSLPRWYIAVLATNSVVVALDGFAYWHFFRESSGYDLQPVLKDTVQILVAALIWIPYMRVSDRVKATFVRPSKIDSPA